MQIRDYVLYFLIGELITHRGHHLAAGNNGLFHEPIVGDQPAGKIRPLVQAFQSRTFQRLVGIRLMTNGAIEFENAASVSLLFVETKFGIGF